MTLVEMIRKREILGPATATVATTATPVREARAPSFPIAKDTAAQSRPTQGSEGIESLPAAPCSDVLLEDIPALPDLSPLPNSYCRKCGGGYWIRQTPEVAYQCGRCTPADTHCESVYASGGTPHRISPIKAGWVVTYRDQAGKLCGGTDERVHGTVKECRWDAGRWMVCLTDGQQVPLSLVRAVSQTDEEGRTCSAWTVRDHGYDGEGSKT